MKFVDEQLDRKYLIQRLGLEAVCLTFSGPHEKQVRTYFQLPDYIAIQTYLALGWPAESPLPPGRLSVADVVLARSP